jgi:AcrR family transcriptional regulator
MKQDRAIKPGEERGNTTARARVERLAGPERRAQLLSTASSQFAMTGLHGTTTLTLARAAGVSEAVLYRHFGNKTQLFRETVEVNSETRLRSLDSRLSSIAAGNQIDWIQRIAEATMMICVICSANAILMGWALLEDPEFATDLYRNETGRVRSLWDREGARRFGALRKREPASLHKVPYAVNTCLAHGLWLATLRHTEESARPLARQFAIGVATSAMTVFAPAENGVHAQRDHSSPFFIR